MAEILLFSGGLDSYCLEQVINPDKLLYVDIGTKESRFERRNLEESEKDVEIVKGIDLAQFELDNRIIPYRNSMFVLIAAQYGNEIYLGATKGDTTKDKDYVFKSQMEGHLNYFGLDEHKTGSEGYPYTVHMPFKKNTKTEIVREYLVQGGDPEKLKRESRSCYDGEELECGQCRSCIRKATAFWLNGIDYNSEVQVFEVDPLVYIEDEQHQKMLNRKGEKENYRKLLEQHPNLHWDEEKVLWRIEE